VSAPIPRLRMFAGPNGSGKSTLKSYLPQKLLGVYLNPDEIEEAIRLNGFLDFSEFGVVTTKNEALSFFTTSDFLQEAGYREAAKQFVFSDERLRFGVAQVNSYLASAAGDFLRQKLLAQKVSFTFETVMSHRSKVDILIQAQAAGYRTYLYFVATDDPAINISRVRNRINLGGHDVPVEKIKARYHRSLDLLMEAIQHTNRAYIFDNSRFSEDGKQTWLAEITEGRQLESKTGEIPAWFKRSVLDKIK
jgi:predicted ABC-type ATPase